MRSTIDKKRAPIICAAVIIAILAVILAAVIYPMLGEACGVPAAMAIIAIYGLFVIAVIVGVIIALCQRLREIDSGEEEDAAKY